jgi:hypothetical protein
VIDLTTTIDKLSGESSLNSTWFTLLVFNFWGISEVHGKPSAHFASSTFLTMPNHPQNEFIQAFDLTTNIDKVSCKSPLNGGFSCSFPTSNDFQGLTTGLGRILPPHISLQCPAAR